MIGQSSSLTVRPEQAAARNERSGVEGRSVMRRGPDGSRQRAYPPSPATADLRHPSRKHAASSAVNHGGIASANSAPNLSTVD